MGERDEERERRRREGEGGMRRGRKGTAKGGKMGGENPPLLFGQIEPWARPEGMWYEVSQIYASLLYAAIAKQLDAAR